MDFDALQRSIDALSTAVGTLKQHRDDETETLGQDKQRCLQAIEDLRLSILGPAEYLKDIRVQTLTSTAVNLALERGIIGLLCENGHQNTTTNGLAEVSGLSTDTTGLVNLTFDGLHG